MRELTKEEINKMGVAFKAGTEAAKNGEKYNPYCDETTDAQDFREGKFYQRNHRTEKDLAISGLIGIAARLVRCDALSEIDEICENQKSIKTSVLIDVLNRAENKLKDESVHIRNMTVRLRNDQTN
jgi:hypothetical protein